MSTLNLPLENLAEFCARVSKQEPPQWLARDLIPTFGIALWHGQPRDLKSMTALATGLDLARGRDVFGNPRFKVERPVTVAFVTEEDPESKVYFRASRLVPEGKPENFHLLVRRGITFDNPEHQAELLVWLQAVGAELVIFDPLRAFTGSVDKGPADFQPVARFLRRIQNETDCKSIVIVHHDVKPRPDAQPGTRRRSHEASGGAIFSVSDCPVSFEKTAWNATNVRPEDYKDGADIKPFDITFETPETFTPNGEPTFGAWIRPTVGGLVAVEERKLLRIMESDPLSIPRTAAEWEDFARGSQFGGFRKGSAAAELQRLHAKGAVRLLSKDEVAAQGRSSKAKLYTLAARPNGGSAAQARPSEGPSKAPLPPLPPTTPATPGQCAPQTVPTTPPLVGGSGTCGVSGGNGNGRLPRESGVVPAPAEPINPYLELAEGAEVQP